MNWYYADNGKPKGPVSDAEWSALIAGGKILPETLVWREGMEKWLPYGEMALEAAGARASVCTECNRLFPLDELQLIGPRRVCAECEPAVRRQLGTESYGAEETIDAATLQSRVEGRELRLNIGSTLSRTWSVVRANFWPSVGVTFLGYALMIGAGAIPLLGIIATFCVQPQMTAGLYWYFLKQIRGQKAEAADIFAGFRRGYWQQVIYMLIIFGMIFAVLILFSLLLPIAKPLILHSGHDVRMAVQIGGGLIAAVVILGLMFLFICWTFTPLLILDKGLKATEAMRLSWRAMMRVFWKFLLLMLAIAALAVCGMLALLIGLIFVLPIAFGSIAQAYEDIFGENPTAAADAL